MPCRHEFGIIDNIKAYSEGEYNPSKYHCIEVEDDLIGEIYYQGFGERMQVLETFVNNTHTPYKDLGYYGITLIPPTSLAYFKEVILWADQQVDSKEFEALARVISEAIERNLWMIHYGI